jgi:hypothetical protein
MALPFILRQRPAPNVRTRCLRMRTDLPMARVSASVIWPTIVKCTGTFIAQRLPRGVKSGQNLTGHATSRPKRMGRERRQDEGPVRQAARHATVSRGRYRPALPGPQLARHHGSCLAGLPLEREHLAAHEAFDFDFVGLPSQRPCYFGSTLLKAQQSLVILSVVSGRGH